MRFHGWLVFLTALAAVGAVEPYDLVIYGSTPAAITAAIEADACGRTAIIVCPEDHVGGMTTNGLGWTDAGKTEAIGGRARDFYREVWKHYREDAAWTRESRESYAKGRKLIDDVGQVMWTFEPHVAQGIFDRWLKDAGIEVLHGQWLDREKGVTLEEGRIRRICMLSGREIHGHIFMDATYEGDLMAAAGVPYRVGREANAEYGETLNGIQTAKAVSHQFKHPVDPYKVPGDPQSGLLSGIDPSPPGNDGDADSRVQAYCFRLCLSRHPDNRVPFPKPEGYDPADYELLLRYFQAGWSDWREVSRKFDPMPNQKTDSNNHGGFSFDFIGMNHDYPEADYLRRKAIVEEHRRYQQGLLWFMANDPRVPEGIRDGIASWGLAADEFKDHGNWPRQLYIREARRMRSDFVMTERHVRRRLATPDPIGMGSYNIDSHHVRRYVDAEGHVRNEGDVQVPPGGPYPIGYGAVVPPKGKCANLLVPVCLSATHAAYGSIRMEPVFMILGQSAAIAADLALDSGVPLQDIDRVLLRQRLDAAGQMVDLK
ncbi:MAG: FAD-dependent oxidoreductase [Akkermansiaceae bacterium]|jgi:hypothetical protein|nr:FAD-dependent oxidoreductase [Akkermansiaceae bacterium]